jgi:hypothetical protein
MSNIKNEKLKDYVENMEKSSPVKETTIQPMTKREPVKEQHFDSFTMGIVYKEGIYNLIRVPLDTVTMTSGTPVVVATEGSQYAICERFKIIAANEMDVL